MQVSTLETAPLEERTLASWNYYATLAANAHSLEFVERHGIPHDEDGHTYALARRSRGGDKGEVNYHLEVWERMIPSGMTREQKWLSFKVTDGGTAALLKGASVVARYDGDITEHLPDELIVSLSLPSAGLVTIEQLLARREPEEANGIPEGYGEARVKTSAVNTLLRHAKHEPPASVNAAGKPVQRTAYTASPESAPRLSFDAGALTPEQRYGDDGQATTSKPHYDAATTPPPEPATPVYAALPKAPELAKPKDETEKLLTPAARNDSKADTSFSIDERTQEPVPVTTHAAADEPPVDSSQAQAEEDMIETIVEEPAANDAAEAPARAYTRFSLYTVAMGALLRNEGPFDGNASHIIYNPDDKEEFQKAMSHGKKQEGKRLFDLEALANTGGIDEVRRGSNEAMHRVLVEGTQGRKWYLLHPKAELDPRVFGMPENDETYQLEIDDTAPLDKETNAQLETLAGGDAAALALLEYVQRRTYDNTMPAEVLAGMLQDGKALQLPQDANDTQYERRIAADALVVLGAATRTEQGTRYSYTVNLAFLAAHGYGPAQEEQEPGYGMTGTDDIDSARAGKDEHAGPPTLASLLPDDIDPSLARAVVAYLREERPDGLESDELGDLAAGEGVRITEIVDVIDVLAGVGLLSKEDTGMTDCYRLVPEKLAEVRIA